MFYVYLALGYAVFFAGLFLIPGWLKLPWIVVTVAIVAAVPMLLGKILDPLNSRRITKHLAATGATDIEIRPYPNHYGANFTRNGVRRYARCSVKRGKVKVSEAHEKSKQHAAGE